MTIKVNLGGRPSRRMDRIQAAESQIGAMEPRARADAARSLAMMAKTGDITPARATRLLAPMVNDLSVSVRLTACGALCSIDAVTWAPRLGSILLSALAKGEAVAETARAAGQLAAFGDSTLSDTLREAADAATRDAGASIRVRQGAEILGELAAAGDASAVRPLVALLSDPLRSNQDVAARALARSRRPEAIEALRRRKR